MAGPWSAFILRRNHEGQNPSEILPANARHLRVRQHLYCRRHRAGVKVDICSACHPFYTGEQRIVDTAGQVDRFMKRLERTADTVEQIKAQQEALRREAQAARIAKRRGDA